VPHRAGQKEVVLRVRNGPDVEDVPEEVRDIMTFHMTFHLATTIADVIATALPGGDASAVDHERYLLAVA
jgi:ATP-dependent Lon protease